jgi:hypothetical protein
VFLRTLLQSNLQMFNQMMFCTWFWIFEVKVKSTFSLIKYYFLNLLIIFIFWNYFYWFFDISFNYWQFDSKTTKFPFFVV